MYQIIEYDYSVIIQNTIIECVQKLCSVRFMDGADVAQTKLNRETERSTALASRTRDRLATITTALTRI